MAIPKFTEDLAIISKLGDNPGTDNNLTAAELRAKFDAAALLLQKFINDTLIPAANASSSPQDGLTMQGPIDMGGQKLFGLNDPEEDDEAATKEYVDTAKGEAAAYTDSQVRRASHTNLLDNSDFTNAVNQRGVSNGDFSWTYTIDRWMVNGNGFVFDGSGVTIPNGGYFFQRIATEYAKLVGNLTFAVTLADDTRIVTTGDKTVNGIKIHVANAESTYFECTVENTTGAPITVKNAAVYEGIYTDETVPEYKPKGYGAELAECQRYYLDHLEFGYGFLTTTQMYASAPIPRKMRVTPTVTIKSNNEIRAAGKNVAVTNATVSKMTDGTIIILVSFDSTTGVASNAGIWRGQISLSADL